MIYDVNYFINKFSAIPEEKWIESHLEKDGKCCANGHCDVRSYIADGRTQFSSNKESVGLCKVFSILDKENLYGSLRYPNYSNLAASINNGGHPYYQQETPKKRILAALEDIKKLTYPTKTVYVKVKEEVEELTEELCLQ